MTLSASPIQASIQTVFIDETAFAAFLNPADPHYIRARSIFLDLDDLDRDFVTTNSIVFDVHQWLCNDYGYELADFFLNSVEKAASCGRLAIIPGSSELEQESRRLLLERPELKFSLTEALTAVAMTGYGIKRIFTFNNQMELLRGLDPDIKLLPTIW
jgi:predicted nucleic acid-binding protein